jgi:hypothetical protein
VSKKFGELKLESAKKRPASGNATPLKPQLGMTPLTHQIDSLALNSSKRKLSELIGEVPPTAQLRITPRKLKLSSTESNAE